MFAKFISWFMSVTIENWDDRHDHRRNGGGDE